MSQPGAGPAGSSGGTEEQEPAVCSRKGCRADASWALLWNNPALHTPDRRKTWAACDEHRQHLEEFLGARGFMRDVRPLVPGAS